MSLIDDLAAESGGADALRNYDRFGAEAQQRLNPTSALRDYNRFTPEVGQRLGGAAAESAPAAIADTARPSAQVIPINRAASTPAIGTAPSVPATIADAARSSVPATSAAPTTGTSVIGRLAAKDMGMADVVQPRAIAAEAPAAAGAGGAAAEQAAARGSLRAIGSRLLGPAVAAAVEGSDVVKVARDPNSTAGDVAQQALESGAKVAGAAVGGAALSPIPVVGPVVGSAAGYKVTQEGIGAVKQGVNELRAMFNLPPMDTRSPVDRIAQQPTGAVGQANAAPTQPAGPDAGGGRGFVNPPAVVPAPTQTASAGAASRPTATAASTASAGAPPAKPAYVLGENAVEIVVPGQDGKVALFGPNGQDTVVPKSVFDAGQVDQYLAARNAATLKAADPLATTTAAKIEEIKAHNQGALDVANVQYAAGKIPAGYKANPDGSVSPIKGGPADIGKALPQPAVKDLSAAGTAVENTNRLASTFKPNFGGHTVLGDMSNTFGRLMGDKSGQAQWWQDMDTLQNSTRHELFGSALTNTELAAWEKTSISPRMDPGQIQQNLQRRAEIEARAASKLANAYTAAGYNKDQIRELLGTAAQYIAQPAPPVKGVGAAGTSSTQPVRKSIGGKTYENDGKGWYEVQ